ncbi:MAG: ChaN family lipoprotein [Cyclobacteriaceae bacterium]|nr:ChaN family lipoprotein [Cyclobacteriaceae bacterium]
MKHLLTVAMLISLGSFQLVAQSSGETPATYLAKHSRSPEDYVIDKFKTNDVVLFGEHHLVRQNLLFVQQLVPALYKNGIYTIGMEFGASEMQDKLDQLVNAEVYDEALAREIMYAYNVTWAYQEYIDVYKAAWKLNRSLPPAARKFRILNLSYIYHWERFTGRNPESMKAVFPKGTADKYRAEIIEKEIFAKNEKLLALVGTPHAYTRYGSAFYKYNGDNFYDYDRDWLGNRLLRNHPGKVFNILLHQDFTKKVGDAYVPVSPADGAIEKLMEAMGNKPTGFDLLNTPVGKLPDTSLHAVGYEGFTLDQFFDGYIFLEPLRKLQGCTVIEGFVTEKNLQHTLEQFPDPDWHESVKTLEDVIEFIQNNPKQVGIKYSKM